MTAKAPTSYKPRFEREQHRRQHLERRLGAMQQEIDALKWRLHVARREPDMDTPAPLPPCTCGGSGGTYPSCTICGNPKPECSANPTPMERRMREFQERMSRS